MHTHTPQAGTERLDRELTIGQMQGKFQLVLLPQVGGWVLQGVCALGGSARA